MLMRDTGQSGLTTLFFYTMDGMFCEGQVYE